MWSFTTNSGTKKRNKLLPRATRRYLLFLTLPRWRYDSVLCLLVSKGKHLRKWDKYLEQPWLDPCTCYLSTHLALHVILQLFPQLRQFLVEETSFPRNFLLMSFFLFSSSFFIPPSQFSFLLSSRRVRSVLSINYPHLVDVNNFSYHFTNFPQCIAQRGLVRTISIKR